MPGFKCIYVSSNAEAEVASTAMSGSTAALYGYTLFQLLCSVLHMVNFCRSGAPGCMLVCWATSQCHLIVQSLMLVQVAIQNATTLEDVHRLEQALKSGAELPTDTAMTE